MLSETDWYLKSDTPSNPALLSAQQEIVKEVLSTIHSELSPESKQQIFQSLHGLLLLFAVNSTLFSLTLGHLHALEQKVLYASDAELRSLAHEMGLGASVNDIPANASRKYLVEFVMKYGRAK